MSTDLFLTLPAEIRNQIYTLLLVVPPPSAARPLGSSHQLHPKLLLLNRQIYTEARSILYGANTFIAHYSLLSSLPQLRRWQFPVTAAPLIALIRRFHIYVRLDCDPRFTADAARCAFSGVEELTVEVYQAQFGGSDYSVLRLFEKIRAVKRTKVFGSVTAFPDYVRWLEDAMMNPVGVEVAALEPAEGVEAERDIWSLST